MTVSEKKAWISLIVSLTIWSGYAGLVGWHVLAGDDLGRWPVALFVEGVVVSLGVQFGLSLLARWRALSWEAELVDERERLIEGRAAALGYGALITVVVGVALACALVIGVGLPVGSYRLVPDGALNPTVVMAGGLLLAIVLAEMLKSATVLVLHRRAL
jgi:hypothetical protein